MDNDFLFSHSSVKIIEVQISQTTKKPGSLAALSQPWKEAAPTFQVMTLTVVARQRLVFFRSCRL